MAVARVWEAAERVKAERVVDAVVRVVVAVFWRAVAAAARAAAATAAATVAVRVAARAVVAMAQRTAPPWPSVGQNPPKRRMFRR